MRLCLAYERNYLKLVVHWLIPNFSFIQWTAAIAVYLYRDLFLKIKLVHWFIPLSWGDEAMPRIRCFKKA